LIVDLTFPPPPPSPNLYTSKHLSYPTVRAIKYFRFPRALGGCVSVLAAGDCRVASVRRGWSCPVLDTASSLGPTAGHS